ncbi:MAG: tRNA (N(6)-L-threonylcarbamoyladenosine(37)-C(2))-methylthiotransferase [Candidatus Ranarchaeia archaeon]
MATELKKYYLESFGCAMNQADSQFLMEKLHQRGYLRTDTPDKASIIILNTCTVRQSTEGRMINRIKQLDKIASINATPLIIAGCLPSAQPDIVRRFAENAVLLPPRALGLWNHLLSSLEDTQSMSLRSSIERQISCAMIRQSNTIAGTLNGITYTLPISEGCLGSCTYCIVKHARGKLVCFPRDIIMKKLQKAVQMGAKELRITAQDTSAYTFKKNYNSKKDLYDLPRLLNDIIGIPGEFRVRIGMMNPDGAERFFSRLLEQLESPKIYKFLHIPLQSGSNKILAAMNRKYSVQSFIELTKKFRQKFPESTLATDIIVGFPGETEEDFQMTREALIKTCPEKVHLARFSQRPGTRAAMLPQVDVSVVKERSKELAQLRLKIAEAQNRQRIGQVFSVLITGASSKKQILGRTLSYRPVVISPPSNTNSALTELLGRIMNVEIVDAGQVDLKGRIIEGV